MAETRSPPDTVEHTVFTHDQRETPLIQRPRADKGSYHVVHISLEEVFLHLDCIGMVEQTETKLFVCRAKDEFGYRIEKVTPQIWTAPQQTK